MAFRLGTFLAVCIFAIGLLISHPWVTDHQFNPGGQVTVLLMFAGLAAAVWAVIVGLGWVISGGR